MHRRICCGPVADLLRTLVADPLRTCCGSVADSCCGSVALQDLIIAQTENVKLKELVGLLQDKLRDYETSR